MEDESTSPPGQYGIFCEPRGNLNKDDKPRWLDDRRELSYQEASAEADKYNRTNFQWCYYAKPTKRLDGSALDSSS